MTFQYQAESFGLSGEPENITSVKKKKKKKKNKQIKSKGIQNRGELKFGHEKAIYIVGEN